MTQEKTPLNLRAKPFWMKAASIFTLAWIPFVLVYTEGQAEHWLNNTMFLVPIAFWAVVLVIFRKPADSNQ